MQAVSLPIKRLYADCQDTDNKMAKDDNRFQAELNKLVAKNKPDSKNYSLRTDKNLVFLGRLSQKSPTVSHLLINHPEYGKECWDIVHQAINQDKDFRHIAEGEAIWLDTGSKEIYWGKEKPSPEDNRVEQQRFSLYQSDDKIIDQAANYYLNSSILDSSTQGSDLSKAVNTYCGTPYHKLNCYELVVQGLKDIGLKYYGQEGLQNNLIERAFSENRAMNAYLNGEGLIESLGGYVYKNSFQDVYDPEDTAHNIVQELKDRLESGLILSFSTKDQGHTGVISRQDGNWTFINSGRIDNSIDQPKTSHGVEEEDLKAELEKWLGKTKGGDDWLRISIGRLDSDKVALYKKNSQKGTKV